MLLTAAFHYYRSSPQPSPIHSRRDATEVPLRGRRLVVMPEHIHLLITEPEVGSPSTVMQVLKQRTAKALLPRRKRRDPRQREPFGESPGRSFWQVRFYDFNVWSEKKRFEKLRYMHRNPVKRGLVESPEQWRWSSYRFYLLNEEGTVSVNVGWGEISFRDRAA